MPTCLVQLPINWILPVRDSVPSAPTIEMLSARGAILKIQPSPPRRILLLIDASGSMAEGWRDAGTQTQGLVAGLTTTTLLGVASMQDRFRWLGDYRTPPSGYAKALESAFAHTKPKFGTALLDSIAQALTRPDELEPNDAVVAVSDGGDDASQTSVDQVVRALQRARVRLFLPAPNSRVKIGQGATTMVRDSGGAVVSDGAEVTQLLARQLVVTIRLTATPDDSVRLGLRSAPQFKGVRLLSFPRVGGCTPQAGP